MTNEQDQANATKGTWNAQKDKLKLKFPDLKDEDLRYEDGKKDEMLQKVATKVGTTTSELQTIMNN
jgi:hypothetical protein